MLTTLFKALRKRFSAHTHICSGIVSDGDIHITGLGVKGNQSSHSMNSVQSSPMRTRVLAQEGPVSSLETKGAFDIEWTASDRLEVVLHAEEHVHPMIDVTVNQGHLVISAKPGYFSSSKRIVLEVKSPAITRADIRGSGDLHLKGVNGPSLTVNIAGSGGVRASGEVHAVSVAIAGSGDFEGKRLLARVGTLSIKGSGSIHTTVHQDVTAEIRGSGDIHVFSCGGSRQSQIKGSGDIHFH